ncbi:MAG TPA: SRPBCC family protein [Steroidobacteraceae bacterium]|nr:SRPBCC family protein [Steroidobacteraceae bacterium]
MLKKIVAGIVAVAVIFLVVGMLLPRKVHVQRTAEIARPASMVFATVDSFRLFPKWSPWQDLDPNMHQATAGPREGVGAKLVWSGNDKVGTGAQVITAAEPDRSVSSDLDFGRMGIAKSALLLAPSGGSTRVTWSLDTDMGAGPVGRWFGLMMDRMIGKDFDAGLRKLKTLVEGMPNVDIAGFDPVPVDMTAGPILVVSETAPLDSPEIGKAYADAYVKIGKFMAKNKLHAAGAPLGIDGDIANGSFSFQAGMPIDRADVADADGVRIAQSYQGKALKATHVGPYNTLTGTYDAFRAYVAAHDYTPAASPISWYIDDPAKTPPQQLRTEVYWPIR